MKRHVLVVLVVAFGVGMIALGGQKFWEKKEFPDWSKKEIGTLVGPRLLAVENDCAARRGGL